jgi:hypothetical protein
VSTSIDIAGKLPKRTSGSKLPTARFALLLRSGQAVQTVMTDILKEFVPLTVEVKPLSASQPRVLILRFPDFLMTADPSVAFDLANRLSDRWLPIHKDRRENPV